MASLDFEGRKVPIEDGDTVASALYRDGVRTFTRSFKYHRRRGLYCLTGDCPNCLVGVNGDPAVKSCVCDARDGMKVEREDGTPSADFDALAVMDRLHRLTPVGFYYKTFIRPRWAWEFAEKIIRRATGLGRLPVDAKPSPKPARFLHADVLVVGGGTAGLSVAIDAARSGESVVLCDEGKLGEKLPPGPTRDRVGELSAEAAAAGVTILERHAAIGIYEGPLVPLVGDEELVQIRPERVVVATGAVEMHGVFPGNDLPGIWLGRGAARMAGSHGVRPGGRALLIANTAEAEEQAAILRDAGVEVEFVRDAEVVRAVGRKRVKAVVVREISGSGERRIECDALVLSLGFSPRDTLLRMGSGLAVTGVGDVAPGREPADAPIGSGGYVCLCEDVGVSDLEQSWEEGWHSSEILKRYTTATMGPCQGAMCGRHLACFVKNKLGDDASMAGARTTARPPARAVRLEDLAGAVHEVIQKRTALHSVHLEAGARLDWSGSWMRPYTYGDLQEEYRAVRHRASVMDVGTLAKFLVAGRDAPALVDRVFPTKIDNLEPGRSRYMLALDEAGYVADDGVICALEEDRFYVTSTSGGADAMEARLRDWADRWDLHVHLVNQTPMLGAINLAGPRAREVLARVSDDPIDSREFPYMAHREIVVAGIPCLAIRVGFVGEISFELHHPRSRGEDLWNALTKAGEDFGLRPHGLDALDVLRLEKGHVYLAQDTLPDDHPAKLGMNWAVDMSKPAFVGRTALERMAEFPLERKLVALEFAGDVSTLRGAPLYANGKIVGRVTSCANSPVLKRSVGLGWIRSVDGVFAVKLRAGDEMKARVVEAPFYDPQGARLRA